MQKRLVTLCIGMALIACHKPRTQRGKRHSGLHVRMGMPAALHPLDLRVTKVDKPLKIDGKWTEHAWPKSARTGAFKDAKGRMARPWSEARFLWDARYLYVGLHAGDLYIRANVHEHDGPVFTDDSFRVKIRPAHGESVYEIDCNALGVITDARISGKKIDLSWESRAIAAVDYDGTINDDTDFDEEWFVELAIPWKGLGMTPKPGLRFSIAITRCDVPVTKYKDCGYAIVRMRLSEGPKTAIGFEHLVSLCPVSCLRTTLFIPHIRPC